jgi:hypothetical protein
MYILSETERTSPPLLYSDGQLHGAARSGYGSACCPPVVDPYTLLALLAGIALATYFLRVALIAMGMGRSLRRGLGLSDITLQVSTGKFRCPFFKSSYDVSFLPSQCQYSVFSLQRLYSKSYRVHGTLVRS